MYLFSKKHVLYMRNYMYKLQNTVHDDLTSFHYSYLINSKSLQIPNPSALTTIHIHVYIHVYIAA